MVKVVRVGMASSAKQVGPDGNPIWGLRLTEKVAAFGNRTLKDFLVASGVDWEATRNEYAVSLPTGKTVQKLNRKTGKVEAMPEYLPNPKAADKPVLLTFWKGGMARIVADAPIRATKATSATTVATPLPSLADLLKS